MSPKLLNLLLAILPVALFYGYIDPLYNGGTGLVWTPDASIAVLKAQNVQYDDALRQIDTIEQEINKIVKDYDSVDQSTRNKVAMLLPDTIDPVRLRNEVVSIADKSGIAITGLKVVENVRSPLPQLGAYRVTFTVKSHYTVIKKLLESYEKSLRLFITDSVSIEHFKKKEDDLTTTDDGETLMSSISFDIYYLRK